MNKIELHKSFFATVNNPVEKIFSSCENDLRRADYTPFERAEARIALRNDLEDGMGTDEYDPYRGQRVTDSVYASEIYTTDGVKWRIYHPCMGGRYIWIERNPETEKQVADLFARAYLMEHGDKINVYKSMIEAALATPGLSESDLDFLNSQLRTVNSALAGNLDSMQVINEEYAEVCYYNSIFQDCRY